MGQDEEFLDLIVERFEFDAGTHPDKETALDKAAHEADTILYFDIYGALELDLVTHWKKSVTYPSPSIRKEGNIAWKPKRFILPQDYEKGIRWIPFDGMQQFDVQIEARQTSTGYNAIVKLVAYVWDDIKAGEGRIGCLLDLVDRTTKYNNRCKPIIAETTKVKVPMDRNKMENINNASLYEGQDSCSVLGFEFLPNEIGDISYTDVTFTPIDIKERQEDCQWRDR